MSHYQFNLGSFRSSVPISQIYRVDASAAVWFLNRQRGGPFNATDFWFTNLSQLARFLEFLF
jgi:hypothetical protein